MVRGSSRALPISCIFFAPLSCNLYFFETEINFCDPKNTKIDASGGMMSRRKSLDWIGPPKALHPSFNFPDIRMLGCEKLCDKVSR
jgi:hypothetical protein